MAPPAAIKSTITSCCLTGQESEQGQLGKRNGRLSSASGCGQPGSSLTLRVRTFQGFSLSSNQGWDRRRVHCLLRAPASCPHLQPTPLQAVCRAGPYIHILDGPGISDSPWGTTCRALPVLASSEGQRQVRSARAPRGSVLAHPSPCSRPGLYQA